MKVLVTIALGVILSACSHAKAVQYKYQPAAVSVAQIEQQNFVQLVDYVRSQKVVGPDTKQRAEQLAHNAGLFPKCFPTGCFLIHESSDARIRITQQHVTVQRGKDATVQIENTEKAAAEIYQKMEK